MKAKHRGNYAQRCKIHSSAVSAGQKAGTFACKYRTIYVVAAEGLIRSVEEYLDHQLRRDSSYLGCLEIDPANHVHWVLYTQKLPGQDHLT